MELVDLRPEPLESLPQTIEQLWNSRGGPLLTVSGRPSKKWLSGFTFARPLRLSSAPLYELILWLDPQLELLLPADVAREQKELLEEYKLLFSHDHDEQRYLELLHHHITYQERELYPWIAGRLPAERALRELGYEHRGLEKESAKLGAALRKHRRGELSRKAKEQLDLDFYHLLEHHIERERDALLPAWLFLSQEP